ncbi:MAG: YitT family protein [Candidatus Scatovivens sp.]
MKLFKEIILSIIGCLLLAIGTCVFLLPNKLSSGGFSGIATIAYYLFKVKMGTTIILLNIPLFIITYFKLGKIFLFKSAISTIVFSKLLDLFNNIYVFTEDRLLASIYGGIFVGIGSALVLKAETSTGGTDLIVQVMKSYKPHIKMGNILVIIDILIVFLNLVFLKTVDIGLYSFIAIYIVGKMIDIVFEGINFSKMIYIISDKSYEISDQINFEFKKGVTGFYAKGMYTKVNKLVIMCVAKRNDIMKIKQLALEKDKEAFIIITDAREVYGLGFGKNNE